MHRALAFFVLATIGHPDMRHRHIAGLTLTIVGFAILQFHPEGMFFHYLFETVGSTIHVIGLGPFVESVTSYKPD